MEIEESFYGRLFDKENGLGQYITEEGMRTLFDLGAGFMGFESGLELGRQLTENYNWLLDKENGLGHFITEDVTGRVFAIGAGFLGLGNYLGNGLDLSRLFSADTVGRLFTVDTVMQGVNLGRKLLNTSSMIFLQMVILTIFGVVFGFLQVGMNTVLNSLNFTQNATITDLIRIFPFSVDYIDELQIFPTID